MSGEIKTCYICRIDNSHPPIYLPNNKEIFVGRNVDSQITDTKCSRQQVRLYASYTDKRVFITQVGSHSSGLNGFKTKRNVKYTAKHGDRLEILYEKYSYRIEFNPTPVEKYKQKLQKRFYDADSENDEVDTKDCGFGKKSRVNGEEEKEEAGVGILEMNNQSSEKNMDNNIEEATAKEMSSFSNILEKTESSGQNGEEKKGTSVEASDVNNHSNEENIDDEVDKETVEEIMSKIQDDRELKSLEEIPSCSNAFEKTANSEGAISVVPTKQDLWEEIDDKALLIYTSKGVEGRSKIAAYDMDGTLIKTISGLVRPKDCSDWQLLYLEVPAKLKKLYADGYKIVIFTNQASLGLGKMKPSDFKQKIERVVKKLGVPVQAFIAAGRSKYRKPVTGMWDVLINEKNDGVPVNKAASFYVGDAAGREKDWAPKRKKDHSSADRLMALNLDLTFHTPEEHFLGQKRAPYVLPSFDPKVLKKDGSISDPSDVKLITKNQEVIIMVGGPGSGKSHVAKNYLPSYIHINRDTLGSWQKCVAAMEKALSEGKSVVVDNTNPNPVARQKYILIAKAHDVPVRCFVMTTSAEHSKHNNKFRELTDESHTKITDVIINSYTDTKSQLVWRCIRFVKLLLLFLIIRLYAQFFTPNLQPYRKNYQPPTVEEGFSEIVRINFVPQFRTDKDRKLYEMYLLEK